MKWREKLDLFRLFLLLFSCIVAAAYTFIYVYIFGKFTSDIRGGRVSKQCHPPAPPIHTHMTWTLMLEILPRVTCEASFSTLSVKWPAANTGPCRWALIWDNKTWTPAFKSNPATQYNMIPIISSTTQHTIVLLSQPQMYTKAHFWEMQIQDHASRSRGTVYYCSQVRWQNGQEYQL